MLVLYTTVSLLLFLESWVRVCLFGWERVGRSFEDDREAGRDEVDGREKVWVSL